MQALGARGALVCVPEQCRAWSRQLLHAQQWKRRVHSSAGCEVRACKWICMALFVFNCCHLLMRAEARQALCMLLSASHPDVQNWRKCSHTCYWQLWAAVHAALLHSLRAAACADVGRSPQHGRDHGARSIGAARAPVQFGRRQLERCRAGAQHCSGTAGVC